MRLLIATDTYYPHINGASYFTQRLSHALQQRGHTVQVIAPSRRRAAEQYTHAGVIVNGLPSLPVLQLGQTNFRTALPPPLLRKDIRRIIKNFQPQVVHVQGHFFIGRSTIQVAHQAKLPLIGTNHFMPDNLLHYLHLPSSLKKLAWQWMWRDFKRYYEQVDAITTPTATAATILNKIGLRQEIHIISCGIDQTIFHPHHATTHLKAHYPLPDKPFLLYVGRLDKEKNLDFILHALARIAPAYRPPFVIAGKGAEEHALHRLNKQLQLTTSTTFLGFVPNKDLPALYCLAACFIMAGTAELQSLVTMEAMASGLPIIAVKALALPELVQPGKNGYLFAAGNQAQAAQAIASLMHNHQQRHAMGKQSISLIQKHALGHVMQQYESLYDRVQH